MFFCIFEVIRINQSNSSINTTIGTEQRVTTQPFQWGVHSLFPFRPLTTTTIFVMAEKTKRCPFPSRPDPSSLVFKLFPECLTRIQEGRCPLCPRTMNADAFNEMTEVEREEFTISGECAHCQRRLFKDGCLNLSEGGTYLISPEGVLCMPSVIQQGSDEGFRFLPATP